MSSRSDFSEPEVWGRQEEPLVTFFLPLPEPLALPTVALPELRKVDAGLLHALEGTTHGRPWADNAQVPGEGVSRNLIRAHVKTASAIFHQVDIDLIAESGVDVAFDVASRAQPQGEDSLPQAALRDEREGGGAVRTVAEVCVPLQVLTAVAAAENHAELAALPTMDDVDDVLLTAALQRCVEYVRSIQEGYHAVTRRPVTLLTDALLPPFVPYLLRTPAMIARGERVAIATHLVHANIAHLVREDELSDEQIAGMFSAVSRGEVLMSYLDLHRQGSVAFHRHGNTREAVVMMASAAEVLLNIVLCMMLWEEGATPEAASRSWPEGLVTRVKNCYWPRIGGQWNLSGNGPVGHWARSVADLRHRTVHAGYLPTADEARSSIEGVEGLLTFLGDRIVYGSNLRKYPRTASQLLGTDGLSRRDRLPRWLRELQADTSEPVWHETFGRWYHAFTRCRGDNANPRASELGRGTYFLVMTGPADRHWVASDPVTRQAALVEVVLEEGVVDPLDAIKTAKGVEGGRDMGFPISIGMESSGVASARLLEPWVEEYHLLPHNGVMVDQTDFAAPWPITALPPA